MTRFARNLNARETARRRTIDLKPTRGSFYATRTKTQTGRNKSGNNTSEVKPEDKGAQKPTSSRTSAAMKSCTRSRTRTPKRAKNPKRPSDGRMREQSSDSVTSNESKTSGLPSLQPVQKKRMLKNKRNRAPNSRT